MKINSVPTFLIGMILVGIGLFAGLHHLAYSQTTTCGEALPSAWKKALHQQGVTLVYAPLSRIETSKPVELLIEVCSPTANAVAKLIKADATMPAHKHGMNYRVDLAAEGARIKATGFYFHMRGVWRLEFDVEQNGQRIRFYDDLSL